MCIIFQWERIYLLLSEEQELPCARDIFSPLVAAYNINHTQPHFQTCSLITGASFLGAQLHLLFLSVHQMTRGQLGFIYEEIPKNSKVRI